MRGMVTPIVNTVTDLLWLNLAMRSEVLLFLEQVEKGAEQIVVE
jgi:hypothetical protein